jgi:hypothetical protein
MADEIIELLEKSKIREVVMKTIQEVWQHAGFLYDNPNDYMEEYLEKNKEESLWEEAWWQTETYAEIQIQEAFEEYVIQKMAKPHRLILEELVETFFNLAKPDEKHFREFEEFSSDDCNNLYMVFVNYVKNHILSYRYSDPFPICMVTNKEKGEWLMEGFALGYNVAMANAKGEKFQPENLSESIDDEESVWNKNNISVRLPKGPELIGEKRPGGKKLYHLLAVIEGEMSTSACSMLQNEMSRIIPTAIRSADLLQTTGFGGEYKVIEPTIPVVFEREIKGLPWGEEKLIENGKPLIRQYLDAYYSEPTKKDSIQRRIRNATCLLIESDNQTNNAVGLALSIAAIEALLGEKGQEVTTKLADNVAVLLEPDLSKRQKATEFVKDLYDTRSRALHGELVETENEARFNARHLAAAVISGVISRRDFLRRLGESPETPEQLLKELREIRFDSGQPMGVDEYNICELWRNRTTGKKDSSL